MTDSMRVYDRLLPGWTAYFWSSIFWDSYLPEGCCLAAMFAGLIFGLHWLFVAGATLSLVGLWVIVLSSVFMRRKIRAEDGNDYTTYGADSRTTREDVVQVDPRTGVVIRRRGEPFMMSDSKEWKAACAKARGWAAQQKQHGAAIDLPERWR